MALARGDGMSAPEVAVVLAVYEPDPDALDAQIASLATQRCVTLRLLAVIADGTSGALTTEVAARHGLAVELFLPDARTNSYRSFELGLGAALQAFPQADAFTFSDQDDIWHPDRLARGLAALERPGAALAHSDARVVDAGGRVIAPSLFRLERRKEPRSLRDILIRNCVTGMTLIMPRRIAEAALPFPPQAALFFHHDLWIALVAQALGRIEVIRAPLVDYRQHGANVVGAVTETARAPRFASKAWQRHWGGTYYVAAYLAKALYLRMTELAEGAGQEVDRRRLRALAPYLSEKGLGFAHLLDAVRLTLAGYPGLGWHSAMFAFVRMGRATLAARSALLGGYLPALAAFDRAAFSVAPGVEPQAVRTPAAVAATPVPTAANSFRDPRLTRRFQVRIDPNLSGGIAILVPSLNPSEVFAGIATALDIGMGLAARGHRVSFIATDLPIANPSASRSFVLSRGTGGDENVTLVCAARGDTATLAPDASLLATAWWTAHVAADMVADFALPEDGFLYLVQDYEPGFYPWGREHAGALASYDLGATPVFNTTTLRDHVLAEGHFPDADTRLTFHPSIDIGRYAGLKRTVRLKRRLAFYGRPEVARNLFETGVAALDRFLGGAGLAPQDIELVSVGLKHDDIGFANGHVLKSLGKIPWDDYPGFLAETDIGLSLMLSPHPSHPPIEMAAAGARVVTNGFGAKDLSVLSPAIRSVPPTELAIAAALHEAWGEPPPGMRDRLIDLTRLGCPLDDLVSRLAVRLDKAAGAEVVKARRRHA
ncbi:glycosyl transferase family 1 [Alphaproteobacteria bacterium GH1-50]|uniref:Glycosyl transferase family 1 n=1 Tax=Kangsaoukella pontilimi TaxID=2691042 RepID=A0A7C9MEY2_9RHOB|nr:glycosyl transferase family 1 [Kangsaoukella pontilimi]MXQ09131.1 glycosyl transferase family 1 [Kangsaoukella pontilimi]